MAKAVGEVLFRVLLVAVGLWIGALTTLSYVQGKACEEFSHGVGAADWRVRDGLGCVAVMPDGSLRRGPQ